MQAGRMLFSALAATMAPIAAVADVPRQSGLSMYVARIASTALPLAPATSWGADTGWDSYRTISRLAEMLLSENRFGDEIATATTDSIAGFPNLVLTDEDGDKRADFYAYYDSPAAETTVEFGVYFTRPDDLRPAWLVVNRGPASEGTTDGLPAVFWVTRQYIDRNGDGRFDLCVANGADTNGDGATGADETGWLFDDDFDGAIDRVEGSIAGTAHRLAPVDGAYRFGGEVGAIDADGPFFVTADAIAADIVAATGGGAR